MEIRGEKSAREQEPDSFPVLLTLLINIQERTLTSAGCQEEIPRYPLQMGLVSMFMQPTESVELAAFHFALF